jgi:hypothetical protein
MNAQQKTWVCGFPTETAENIFGFWFGALRVRDRTPAARGGHCAYEGRQVEDWDWD